jgi:MFS family permease
LNFSALQHKNFRVLWLGQAISQLGDAFYFLVFLFMVKKITGSSALVGYVGALETIPFLLFGAFSGVLADRQDRRSIMLWSDLGSAAILALFAALVFVDGKPPIWSLLVTPFALSSVRCFFMPAKSAAVPSLVPDALLAKANALSSGTQTVTSLVSLSVSASALGLIYALSPNGFYVVTIALNALSFGVSAWFISRLPKIVPDRGNLIETHPWRDFTDGLRFINSRHDLKVVTVLLTVFRLMIAPFFVVALAANDQWFGGKPQTIVWLEVLFSLGMLVGTFVAGKLTYRRPLLWFANGLGLIGFTLFGMAVTPTVLGFAFWQFSAGVVLPPADIPFMTYLQLSVSDGYRGRVNAVRDTISVGVMPLGNVLGGLLVERAGLQWTFIIMGFGTVGGCLLGILDRRYRSAEMPLPEDGPETSPETGSEPDPETAFPPERVPSQA